MQVKICGITNVPDARGVIQSGADFLGLIFAESKRQVTTPQARRITKKFPRFKNWVGVFVNDKAETVAHLAALLGLKYVQLHGDESPAYCKKLLETYRQIKKSSDGSGSLKIIKALRIRTQRDVMRARKYQHCFAVLLDTYSSQVSGGTGRTFDWDLAKTARHCHKNIFLSGGLTEQNVCQAIKTVHPSAVDVSSGVETSPGKKSPARVRRFIRFAKNQSEC